MHGINWIQLSQLTRTHSHILIIERLLTPPRLLSCPACTLVYAACPFVPPHPPSILLRHPSFFFFCFIFLSLVHAIARTPFFRAGRSSGSFFLHQISSHTHSPQFAHQSYTCPENQNPKTTPEQIKQKQKREIERVCV